MAQESNGDSRAILPSGVYRHPDTGEELVTQATANFGNPQADAITRLGFQYVGPADATKLNPSVDPSAGPLANTDTTYRSVGELEADLQAAKEREARVSKALKSESSLVAKQKGKNEAKISSDEAQVADANPANQEKGAN